jgi:S1-C subfamily serine protease
LRGNDVVLQVDNQPIRGDHHLINLISMLSAGQRVRLEVWRDQKKVILEAIVGDWLQGQNRVQGMP